MERVDILLALRTQLAGNAEALAYLDQFEQQGKSAASHVSHEWDALKRKLERKFSLPDIGYDLLRSFGIGSGGALVEHAIEGFFKTFEEGAKKAEEEAKKFAESLDKVVEAAQKLSETKIANWIESLAPKERISAKQKEIASLADQIEEQQKRYAKAVANISNAATTTGKLTAVLTGSPEKGEFNIPGSQAAWAAHQAFIKKNMDAQVDAQKLIVELEGKREDLVKGVAKDEKQVSDDATKAADERLKAAQKNAEEQAKTDPFALNLRITADFIKQAETRSAAQEKSAQAFRETLNPQEQFARKEREIQELLAIGKLTKEEAASAIARLSAEMAKTGGAAELTKAIDASNDALREFGARLAAIDNSTATDVSKRAQRAALLREENIAIEKQIELLKEFADKQPAVDPAAVRGQIRGLQDRSVRNDALIGKPETSRLDAAGLANQNLNDPTKHFQTLGEGATGGLLEQLNEFGTVADQVASTVKDTLGGAVAGVSQGIYGWLTGTQSVQKSLLQIGGSVLQRSIDMLVQIGERQLLNAVIGKQAMVSTEALGDTLRAGRVVKENAAEAATLPMKTAGAAASGISSFGVALVFGAIAVALIAGLAGAFADGGPVSGPGGPRDDRILARLSNKEYVQTAAVTQNPKFGWLMALNEAARLGRPMPAFADGGFASNFAEQLSDPNFLRPVITRPAYQPPLVGSGSRGGRESDLAPRDVSVPVSIVNFDDRQTAEQWFDSAEGHAYFVRKMRRIEAQRT